jgi:hypothetical protein
VKFYNTKFNTNKREKPTQKKMTKKRLQYTLETMYDNATIRPTPFKYKVRETVPEGLGPVLADALSTSMKPESPPDNTPSSLSGSSSVDPTRPWNDDQEIIQDTMSFLFDHRSSSLESLTAPQTTTIKQKPKRRSRKITKRRK